MKLTGKQKSHLRGLAHSLSALVQVGKQGVTEGVVDQIDRCLDAHELIKIKLEVDDQNEFRDVLDELCREVGASLVQTIGHTAVFYRPSKEPKISLPTS